MRGGGQDLRSRQLSEIRQVARIIGMTSIHGSHKVKLNEESLVKAKEHV